MIYIRNFFIVAGLLFSDFSELIPGFKYQNIQLSRFGKNIEFDIFTINPDSIDVDIINSQNNKTIKQIMADKKNNENYFLICNAGMFDVDYKTSMGYMKNKGNILNSRNHPHYYSVMAFDPLFENLPKFYIYDTDIIPFDSITARYDSVIQNLRLIKRDGENRWPEKKESWSELAIGQDADNNIVIIYCKNSLSMFEFNNLVLSLPLGLLTMQHLEGNSAAQLYFKISQYKIDYDNNEYIPNLIAFKVRKF